MTDENRKCFQGKVTIVKNSPRSQKNVSEIEGKSETEEMHHCLRGMDAPVYVLLKNTFSNSLLYATGRGHI